MRERLKIHCGKVSTKTHTILCETVLYATTMHVPFNSKCGNKIRADICIGILHTQQQPYKPIDHDNGDRRYSKNSKLKQNKTKKLSTIEHCQYGRRFWGKSCATMLCTLVNCNQSFVKCLRDFLFKLMYEKLHAHKHQKTDRQTNATHVLKCKNDVQRSIDNNQCIMYWPSHRQKVFLSVQSK